MQINFVLTCFGPSLSPEIRDQITAFLENHKIITLNTKTLSETQPACIEIRLRMEDSVDPETLTKKLLELSTPFGVDIALQTDNAIRRDKKLIVMDMDSTLIQVEVIDELAKEAGIGEAVASITHQTMNGELDFNQSLRKRVGLLKGLPVSVLKRVYDRLPFTLGAENLISILKQCGYKTGVLSGGFDYFTSRVQSVLQLDYAHSNRLEIEDGILTGGITGEIVNGDKKAALMEEIAHREGFSLDQVIAIGDGANDLPMIRKAGLGIAFNAKPAVRAAARYSITQKSLITVLYLLGFSKEEINAFSEKQPG